MYQLSDSDSKDSDHGIRFKTENTRNKTNTVTRAPSKRSPPRSRRDRSPRRRTSTSRSNQRRRSRSRSPRRRRSRSRSSKERKTKAERSEPRRKSPERSRHKARKHDLDKSEGSTSSKNEEQVPTQDSEPKAQNNLKTTTLEKKVIGPCLPPELAKNRADQDLYKDNTEESEELVLGPALPPQFKQKLKETAEAPNSKHEHIIGPALPSHIIKKNDDYAPQKAVVGPSIPPHLMEISSEEAEEDAYGPLPPGSSAMSRSHVALEERALELKLGRLQPAVDEAPEREEWMTELPEVKASKLGLGPRQFRAKAGPDMSDRSSWTNTPNKKKKTSKDVDLKKEAESKAIAKRDLEQEKISKKHKRNKDSLLELHQKKKKKEESGSGERRPFNRDIDLKVNRFDEAQKKAVLKKAQLLDDRFSTGQSKFL